MLSSLLEMYEDVDQPLRKKEISRIFVEEERAVLKSVLKNFLLSIGNASESPERVVEMLRKYSAYANGKNHRILGSFVEDHGPYWGGKYIAAFIIETQLNENIIQQPCSSELTFSGAEEMTVKEHNFKKDPESFEIQTVEIPSQYGKYPPGSKIMLGMLYESEATPSEWEIIQKGCRTIIGLQLENTLAQEKVLRDPND